MIARSGEDMSAER